MSTLSIRGCWIVGYGNRQRRDDGVGPYVVEKLRAVLSQKKRVCLLTLSQLSADLVGDLHQADRILFIDASINELKDGRKWCKLNPEMQALPYLTHHIRPAFLLGLMQTLYGRRACAWLISIHGSDFGFGEGLSPEAARAADRVVLDILAFIRRNP